MQGISFKVAQKSTEEMTLSLTFVIITNLSVCNRDNTPTSYFLSSENCDDSNEVLDITLWNDNGDFQGGELENVCPEIFLDHNWILFSPKLVVELSNHRRIEVIKNKSCSLCARIGNIGTADELESKVRALVKAIESALKFRALQNIIQQKDIATVEG